MAENEHGLERMKFHDVWDAIPRIAQGLKQADGESWAIGQALLEWREDNATSRVTVLPDGSAFGTMSFPLPSSHWLYTDEPNVPPMPFRLGTDDPDHGEWVQRLREAGKYAVRTATMNGAAIDFDPDALVQNLIVGMLGYWTPNGLCGETWGDPDPAPGFRGSVS